MVKKSGSGVGSTEHAIGGRLSATRRRKCNDFYNLRVCLTATQIIKSLHFQLLIRCVPIYIPPICSVHTNPLHSQIF